MKVFQIIILVYALFTTSLPLPFLSSFSSSTNKTTKNLFSLTLNQALAQTPPVVESPIPDSTSTSAATITGFGSGNSTDRSAGNNDRSAELAILSVLMLVVAFYAVELPFSCGKKMFKNISVIGFLLTSLVYLASEFYFMSQYRNINQSQINNIFVNRVGGENYKRQIEVIETYKKTIEGYESYIKNKSIILIVLSVGYFLAAVAALIEAIYYFYDVKAHADAVLVMTTCSKTTQKTWPSKIRYYVESFKPLLKKLLPSQQLDAISSSTITDLLISQAQAQSTAVPTPTPTPGAKDAGGGEDKMDTSNPLNFASFATLLGGAAGGIVVGAILKFSKKVHKKFNYTIAKPFTRTVLFSVFASLAGAAAGMVWRQKETVEARVRYLDSVIRALKDKMTDTVVADDVNLNNIQGGGSVLPGKADVILQKNTQACLTQRGNSFYYDRSCQCQQTPGGCQSSITNRQQGIQNLSYPSAITAGVGALGNSVGSLYGGNFVGAGTSAYGFLGPRMSSYKKLKAQIGDKLNDMRKRKGMKEIDFNAEENKLTNSFKNLMRKIIKEDGASLNSLGNFGGNFDQSNFNLTIDTPDKGLNEKVKALKEAANTAPASGGSAGPAGEENNLFGDDIFNLDGDASAPDNHLAEIEETLPEGFNDHALEVENASISNKTDENIFQIVTKRYFITAFPRLLEEKK